MSWFNIFWFNIFKRKETVTTPVVPTWEHFCVPNSIRDAWTYSVKTKRPVRIAVTKIDEGVDHAQAQGHNESGEWISLTTHNSDGLLREWPSHYPDLTPYRYVELEEWVDQQILFT